MRSAALAAGAFAVVLLLVALAAGRGAFEDTAGPAAASSPASTSSAAATQRSPSPETYQGFLYGRITTAGGATYKGRLRFGGDEEAFWGDYFNGFKDENPWAVHVPAERLTERRPVEILGFQVTSRESRIELGRPFMARFGDIARLEARGRDVRVILKSGTVFDLDRLEAGDFDDGVRVWDEGHGLVDLESGIEDLDRERVETIELLPAPLAPPSGAVPDRLHGTVRTPQGEFTGFLQWDREENLGSDELDGRTAEGELGLPFDTIRSIARHSPDSSLVTLLDGREIVLSDSHEVGHGNRGIYVDDPRYGRVLVSWDAFERVDLRPGASSGPAYGDFPPGRPLTGTVTTRAGRRLAGRLVYDLDESETTETLDAPYQGVDYTLPFARVASIVLPGPDYRGARHARVTLHGGERLRLELTGDLGESNAGLLVFADDPARPEHVPWAEVERIDLEGPPAVDPLAGKR